MESRSGYIRWIHRRWRGPTSSYVTRMYHERREGGVSHPLVPPQRTYTNLASFIGLEPISSLWYSPISWSSIISDRSSLLVRFRCAKKNSRHYCLIKEIVSLPVSTLYQRSMAIGFSKSQVFISFSSTSLCLVYSTRRTRFRVPFLKGVRFLSSEVHTYLYSNRFYGFERKGKIVSPCEKTPEVSPLTNIPRYSPMEW